MKAKIGLAILAVLLVVAFASCDFGGSSMTGTNWRTDANTGVGLKFTTATTGVLTAGAFGIWIDGSAFTYTYNPTTKTGTITGAGSSYAGAFSISVNSLSYSFLTYTYQP